MDEPKINWTSTQEERKEPEMPLRIQIKKDKPIELI